MHWTDTYSHERDMEFRLRDHYRDAHRRRLSKSALSSAGSGASNWFASVRDGLGRSAGLVASAAGGLLKLFDSSEPLDQCC